ncbi:alpha/beta fold hydrolase [Stenotrophomonas maltophilia]|uniref:alpha/beta fold hydrolase n=1 Tax=Stenotrophomonas maltophilia TaxID=40324 RepID=UPI003D7E6E63
MRFLIIVLSLLLFPSLSAAQVPAPTWPSKTYYRTIEIDGEKTFYREAGDPRHPTVLLLHGFPSSSHTYRELIPLLSGRYHVIAPDYLGSGLTAHPDPFLQPYTFQRLAEHIARFTDALDLQHYSLYMQDFGAPVGFRLMLLQPDRLQALLVQNANAYLEGLTAARLDFFRQAHLDRTPARLLQLHGLTSPEGVKKLQYLRDVNGHPERISPDAWQHDLAGLGSHAQQVAQVQLFQDYWANIEAYPQWQAFLRMRRPPTLVMWGRHDPAFISPGATAFTRDIPDAEVHLLDAGHFVVEERPVEIAQHIIRFLEKLDQHEGTGPRPGAD